MPYLGRLKQSVGHFDVESEILSFDVKGTMTNFFCDTGVKPWDVLTSKIDTVIADGIITIGNHALISCSRLNTVLIPSRVRLLG